MTGKPAFADDFHTLATVANDALRQRYATFPGLIGQAKLTQDAAEAELRAWQAIQSDWAAAIGTPRRYRFTAPAEAKLDALRISLDRCNRAVAKEHDKLPNEVRGLAVDGADILELREQHGGTFAAFFSAHRRRDYVKAMLWWQETHGGPPPLLQLEQKA